MEKKYDESIPYSIFYSISISFVIGFFNTMIEIFINYSLLIFLVEIFCFILIFIVSKLYKIKHFPLYKRGSFNLTLFFFGKIMAFCLTKILIINCNYKVFLLFLISNMIYHVAEFLFVAFCHIEELSWNSFLINHSLGYTLAFLSGVIEYIIEKHVYQYHIPLLFIEIIGVIFVITGHFLRIGSFFSAKSNFHHKVQFSKKKTHILIKTGVYKYKFLNKLRYFRHPSYLGFFLWSVGLQTLLTNVICILLHSIILWKFFYERIFVEEQTLEYFFADYRQYKKKAPIGIPLMQYFLDKKKEKILQEID